MERLTIKTPKGAALKMDESYPNDGIAKLELMKKFRVAVDRLAAYEDTGLMPEDVTDLMTAHGAAIEKLAEYRIREEKQAPKCYSADIGGGCRYLVPDGDDEPIGRCKKCPLCYGDKSRRRQPPNTPLTLEELREMDGDKIYINYINGFYTDEDGAYFGKFEQLVRECEGRLTACELTLEYYGKTWLAYRRKPEEGDEMTNADRIRAMSDEQLVEFLKEPFCDKRTSEECQISYCGVCNQCILDWLEEGAIWPK